MHQSTTPSLSQTISPRWASTQFLSLPIVQTLLPVTFGYSLSSETVVMRQLRRWKRLWRRSLTRSHKRTSIGPSRSCWNGTTSALQPEEIISKGTRVSRVLSIKVPIRKKSWNLFKDPRIFRMNNDYNEIYLTHHNLTITVLNLTPFKKKTLQSKINYLTSNNEYILLGDFKANVGKIQISYSLMLSKNRKI